jgi:hypothetical protein
MLALLIADGRANPPPNWDTDPWVKAIIAIDKRGDKEPLMALLESDAPMTADARRHLANLLERYELKRPVGRQRNRSYERAPGQAELDEAEADVRLHVVEHGGTLAAAVKVVAKARKVDVGMLGNQVKGKRRSNLR